MKLKQVKQQHGFHQRTFYRWLRESGLIIKAETGYIVGPNALPGMQTFSRKVYDNGELKDQTQVTISSRQVGELVARYLNSGEENLYSPSVSQGNLAPEKLARLEQRLTILEGQIANLSKP